MTDRRQALPSCVLLIAATTACHQPPAARFQVAWQRDLAYAARAERTLYLDIARPCDVSAPVPGVLLLHGGAWRYNDRAAMSNLAAALASMGYVAAAADLRKSTESDGHFPAAVEDALAALRFLRERATDLGLDADRIALLGESSGGHTALMAAYGIAAGGGLSRADAPGAADSQNHSPVQAVIGLMAPTDLAMLYDDNPYGFGRAWLRDLLGESCTENPTHYRDASPVHRVRADLPPTLLIHGDRDGIVSIRHAEALAERLEQAGVRCWIARRGGGTHSVVGLFRSSEGGRYLPTITQFLATVFPDKTE